MGAVAFGWRPLGPPNPHSQNVARAREDMPVV